MRPIHRIAADIRAASEPNDLHCSACLSTEFTELGTLGNSQWLRCRSCGTSVKA
jgi:hypothetical protein